tara:strand:+ start:203 stop:517 length:315 start_codon:yes stop_codon:yes gene_type:complete
MKLFKAIAVTAAVITCCLGNQLRAEASEAITLPGGAKLHNSEKNPDKRRVPMSADEMKALAATGLLMLIPDGLEALRMQMVLECLDWDMAADARKNLQHLYDHA